MGKSLLTSQCIRTLGTLSQLIFWLGILLENVISSIGQGSQAVSNHPYYNELGDYLASLMASGVLTAESLKKLTNKQIYTEFADFPVPKVVREAPVGLDYSKVWKRLHSPIVKAESRDIMFLLLHNKLIVPERLFRIGVRNDPYCLHCLGAEIGDIEHFFCCCVRTASAWKWFRIGLLTLGGRDGILISNFSLLNLLLPSTILELDIVWLVTHYVHYVWNMAKDGSGMVSVEKMVKSLSNSWREEKWHLKLQLNGLRRIFPQT